MDRCTYTFPPDDGGGGSVPAESTDTDAVDLPEEWTCPHEAHPEGDRCVFHLGRDGREAVGVDAADVSEQFRDLVDATDAGRTELLGADLPTLHLEYLRLGGESRHRIDLRWSDVEALELDHTVVANPFDLRGATLGRVDLTESEFEKGLFLDGATVERTLFAPDGQFDEEVSLAGATVGGQVSLDGATFDDDLAVDGATLRGPVSFAGVGFHGRSNERDENTSFEGTVFEAPVTFDEARFEYVDFADATFADEVTFEAATFTGAAEFDDATMAGLADLNGVAFEHNASFRRTAFEGVADFRGVEFEGGADIRHDDADFQAATFGGRARFGDATFATADFHGTVFAAEAVFEDATFAEDADFGDATFEGLADFDEGRFREDATFSGATFRETADFRGVEFEGGANVLVDDADFEEAVFAGPAQFDAAEFAYADFDAVTFDADASFERARFDEDVHFVGAVFRGLADFDEARFEGDGDFGDVTFEGRADFRGVDFRGEARHLEDNARFESARFEGRAEFDDAVFNAVNLEDVTFAETVDFRRVVVRDRLDIAAASAAETAYVNMTDADLAGGHIVQPADHWVRYDLTRARLGDVSFVREGSSMEIFDYVRFLETDFDGFDFSAHRDALERTDWSLHVFDEAGADYDVALPATPAAIETTYLYAYNNAKAMGDNDAAIEFAIHQATFRRKKNVGYVTDGGLDTGYRLGKLGDVIGNSLWYLTCGYGYRLWRILAASAFVIVAWAAMYALPFTTLDNDASLGSVGDLFSPESVIAVGQYLYYSLITFTTVGYGDINPVNATARTLAAIEGVLGVLLAALVIFVLGRRVSV
jgi:uncharacterized protein YjbI with pentapeptide repeats